MDFFIPQNVEDKKQQTKDQLKSLRAEVNVVLPNQLEMSYQAGNTFKDRLTDEQRVHHFYNPLTEIGKKKYNAEMILNAEAEFIKKNDKVAASLVKGTMYQKDDLKGVLPFFSGDKKKDAELTKKWFSRSSKPADALKACMQEFVKLPIDNLDLSSDKKFAEQAPFMEKLGAQYDSLVNMVADEKKIYDKLPEKTRTEFENKIGQVNGLINYYRLMKQILTNPYYVSHENQELSKKRSKKDSVDQRHLMDLFTQGKAGLYALKYFGAKELDNKLEKLIGDINHVVVEKEQLKLQNELAEREKLVEKMGFSEYLRHLENKGNVDGMNTEKANTIFDKALKKVVSLDIPQQVDKGCSSVVAVLNQIQFVERFTKEKDAFQKSFYMDHDYKEVAIMEQVEKIVAPLNIIKTTLLDIANISEKGVFKAKKLTKEEKESLQEKYSKALNDYQNIMEEVGRLRDGGYLKLSPDPKTIDMIEQYRQFDKMSFNEKLEKLSRPKDEVQAAQQEELKTLHSNLSKYDYSEIAIYRNAEKILRLSREGFRTFSDREKSKLSGLAEIAYRLLYEKKTKDLETAIHQKDIPEEEKAVLIKEQNELLAIKENLTDADKEKALEKQRAFRHGLQNEAQLFKYDSEDMKATAAYYLEQDQWEANSKKSEKKSWLNRVIIGTFAKTTKFFGWVFSKTRSKYHGAELYDRAKENLRKMPEGVENLGTQQANLTITHGDGEYAPIVEINKYFKDSMKLEVAQNYREIRNMMNAQTNYPQSIKSAVEALESYTKVRGVVNGDTFEMELAFLDKFKNCIYEMASGTNTVNAYPQLVQKLMATHNQIVKNSGGNLRDFMTNEEFEEAKKVRSIYTAKTYFGDTEESNVRDLPLFPHSPQLNDVKQGVLGNCYMLAAVQTLVAMDPKAVQNMFCDMGDGNVLVRFYAAFGEKDQAYRRIDDIELINKSTTVRPVYVKVRKHYTTGEEGSSYCLWMQLLEKAYAAAGFNKGKQDIDEKGELKNLNDELTEGNPAEVLFHLTGTNYKLYSKLSFNIMNQKDVQKNAKFTEVQKRVLLKDVPAQLHDKIYDEILNATRNHAGFADDSEWTKKLVTGAVQKAIDENKKITPEIVEEFTKLEKAGKITSEEKGKLVDAVNMFTPPQDAVEDYVANILKNIEKPVFSDRDSVDEVRNLSAIRDSIKEAIKEGNISYDMFEEIIMKPRVRYSEVKVEDVSDEQIEAVKYNTGNILIPNIDGKYTQAELLYFNEIRKMLIKGHPVTMCSESGHCMTALDIKLHGGRWFILIRDPFNTYRYKYTRKDDGKVKKDFDGFFTAVGKHLSIKELSPELEHGYLGTSWWELKDVYKDFDNLVLK